jgi:hypothetical protein
MSITLFKKNEKDDSKLCLGALENHETSDELCYMCLDKSVFI